MYTTLQHTTDVIHTPAPHTLCPTYTCHTYLSDELQQVGLGGIYEREDGQRARGSNENAKGNRQTYAASFNRSLSTKWALTSVDVALKVDCKWVQTRHTYHKQLLVQCKRGQVCVGRSANRVGVSASGGVSANGGVSASECVRIASCCSGAGVRSVCVSFRAVVFRVTHTLAPRPGHNMPATMPRNVSNNQCVSSYLCILLFFSRLM